MKEAPKIGSPEEEVKDLVKLGLDNLTVGSDAIQVTDNLTLSAHIGKDHADIGFEVKF